MTSTGDHKVIETRNMSAEMRLQTVLGNTHEREGRGVPLNARRSKLLILKPYRWTKFGDAYVCMRDNRT